MNSDHEIQQMLQELAQRRRKGLIFLLAGAVCPFLLILLPNNDAWWITVLVTLDILAAIFLIIYGLIVWIDASGRLKDIISEAFMPEALGNIFSQVEYQQNHHIPKEAIDAVLMQHYWESTGGNDYVRANYRGLPLEFSDMRLTYETGMGKDSRTRSAFSGLYIICSFDKGFPADLLLIERRRIGLLGAKPPEDMQIISSGYEALDKKFLLIADNLLNAQSILTPQTVESILRMHAYTNGRCSLKLTRDGKAHAAIDSGRNAFEPGKRIEEAEQRIAEEICYVTDIIEMLLSAFSADEL